MIEISKLAESDRKRKVAWSPSPHLEYYGQLVSWSSVELLVAFPKSKRHDPQPARVKHVIESVPPNEARFVDDETKQLRGTMAQKTGTKLLNYTTAIEPIKTASEVMGMLAAKGVKSINIDYSNGEPTGLSFMIEIKSRPVYFRLPCNYAGAERALQRTAPARYRTSEQATRVAWRIVKDWVEAQLAIIECGQAEMAEVFLAYAITETGQTLFQRMTQNPSWLLTDGGAGAGNVIEGQFQASGA